MLKNNQSTRQADITPIPKVTLILTGAVGVIGSNSLVLSPIAAEVSQSLGATVPGVMTAAAAYGLGTAASALVLAPFIDRFGAWRLLKLSLAVLAAALAISALAGDVVVLTLAQLAAGIAAGIALPAIYTNAASIAPPGRENETIGIVLAGWTLSLVAGVSLSAVLADLVDWRAVYWAVGLLALLTLIALSLDRRRDKISRQPALSPLAALSIPRVLPLLAAQGAFMAAFYGVYGYMGAYMAAELGQPTRMNGLLTLIYGAGFGGAVLFNSALKRFSPHRTLPAMLTVTAVIFLAMMPGSRTVAGLLCLALLWGLANHCVLNMLIVRLGALDPARRGAVMGMNSAVTYLAAFAGTLLFGLVYARWGFSANAALGAVLALIAAVFARPRLTLPTSSGQTMPPG